MAKERKARRNEMTDRKRNIIQQLLQEYDIETAEDIQDALKDLLGGTIKEMTEAEIYLSKTEPPTKRIPQ
jgi:putative transposase